MFTRGLLRVLGIVKCFPSYQSRFKEKIVPLFVKFLDSFYSEMSVRLIEI